MISIKEKTFSWGFLERDHTAVPLREAVSYAGIRISFVVKGTALWQIDGKNHETEPGDIFFLSEGQKRRFLSFCREGFSLFTMTLDRRVFLNPRHFSFFMHCIREKHHLFRNLALTEILRQIVSEVRTQHEDHREMVSAKLTEFFILAERLLEFRMENTPESDRTMLKILDYIDANLTEKITLTEVASLAGLTDSSFSRWFSRCCGISFKKYVMTRRIELAVSLLETTHRKVIDIAQDCGFSSISGFYDAFKKITGTTPNQYGDVV